MRFGRLAALIIAAFAGFAPAAEPQAAECSGGLCTEARVWTVAELSEDFRHGFEIAETEIDLLAALEQQRWRELRFRADAPARIYTDLRIDTGYRPADWPDGADLPQEGPALRMLYSLDGNAYRPMASGFAVPDGAVVSVIVGQPTARSGTAGMTFFPARWTLTVTARRTWAEGGTPPAAEAGAPVSRMPDDPRPEFDPLPGNPAATEPAGCIGPECTPAAPPAAAEDAPPGRVAAPGGDPVAAELQAELARVGCYRAEVDGLWGPASRAAMAAFNRETGGKEPVAAPTAGALVAVARVPATVCGAD
ncbi:MAG: peptidoglycan-binding domain-containing protein [Rhodobacter sp.]|nr:peptidoglycan-binding domain-containing protein [Rhodobacter sp.]